MYFFPYFIFLVVEKDWKMLSNSRQKGAFTPFVYKAFI